MQQPQSDKSNVDNLWEAVLSTLELRSTRLLFKTNAKFHGFRKPEAFTPVQDFWQEVRFALKWRSRWYRAWLKAKFQGVPIAEICEYPKPFRGLVASLWIAARETLGDWLLAHLTLKRCAYVYADRRWLDHIERSREQLETAFGKILRRRIRVILLAVDRPNAERIPEHLATSPSTEDMF